MQHFKEVRCCNISDDLKLIISLFIPLSDDLEDTFLFKGQQFHKIELADPQIFLVNS